MTERISLTPKELQVEKRLKKVYENDIKPHTPPFTLGKDIIEKLFSYTEFKSKKNVIVISDCGLLWSLLQKCVDLNILDKIEVSFLCHTSEQKKFAFELKELVNINIYYLPYKKLFELEKYFDRSFKNMKFDTILINSPFNMDRNSKEIYCSL